MSLNIGGSGIAKPFVKFNSKADKWFVRGPDGEDAEIERPTFVVDLDNIATGWVRFREGQAPERVIDPSLDQAAPSPGEGFKRGFVVATFSRSSLAASSSSPVPRSISRTRSARSTSSTKRRKPPTPASFR